MFCKISNPLKILSLFVLLGTTQAAVSNLDRLTESLDGTSSHIDGPNCWNGALHASGIVPSLRFMHPNEWLLHIEEHCVEVEKPQRGDLGRIFHPTEGEVHGFIHLDGETIFAKHGENSMHGYQVMTYEEMLDQYGKTRSCRMSNSSEPHCFHTVKYYSCETSKESFSYQKLTQILQKISFNEETKWSFKSTCESENFLAREALLKEALSLEEIISKEIKEGKIAPQFWSALFESLGTQVYNIQVSNRSYRCKPRNVKYQSVKALRGMIGRLQGLIE